ncbi:MAG: hypothetical protein IJ678_08025 [Kiritimatiellae bacterium]|nr:hypothetical protein [Kiritimatiellia bacterium]
MTVHLRVLPKILGLPILKAVGLSWPFMSLRLFRRDERTFRTRCVSWLYTETSKFSVAFSLFSCGRLVAAFLFSFAGHDETVSVLRVPALGIEACRARRNWIFHG